MKLKDIKTSWLNFVSRMNKKGIPLPTIRDPQTGLGSISLTLVFISFNMVLFGLAGKAAGAFGGIDLTQALNLFYACAALYWGRKFQGKDAAFGDNDPIKVEEPKDEKESKVDSPD
jgi:hypothetical protein